MVVLVGCLVHFLVNGTQVCGWYVVVRQGTDAKERKEDFWNMRKKGQTMLLSQVVLAILVTSFGTPHTVARRLHPDIFTSTGGDKYTNTHTQKKTQTHRNKDTEKHRNKHTHTDSDSFTYTHRQRQIYTSNQLKVQFLSLARPAIPLSVPSPVSNQHLLLQKEVDKAYRRGECKDKKTKDNNMLSANTKAEV